MIVMAIGEAGITGVLGEWRIIVLTLKHALTVMPLAITILLVKTHPHILITNNVMTVMFIGLEAIVRD